VHMGKRDRREKERDNDGEKEKGIYKFNLG
jgi:hypothetical protein